MHLATAQLADIVMMQTNFTEVQMVLFTDLDNDGFFASAGEVRLLYSNGINDENLTSNRDVVFRQEAGLTSTYWIDNRIDRLFRGRDLDASGQIEIGEAGAFRDSVVLDGPSRANGIAATPDNAIWWSSDGESFRGVFRCFDSNGDFDANDPGEQVVMVTGTHPIDIGTGSVGISTGTFTRMTNSGNGVVVFNTLDHSTLFRFEDKNSDGDVTDATESIVFLNATGETPALPMNPDFAAAVAGSNPRSLVVTVTPPSNGWLAHVTSRNEAGADVVYTACDSSSTSTFGINVFGEPINGLIFRCEDSNLDGDANDVGEVVTFYDGSSSTSAPEVFEKVIGLSTQGGWLYVCELNASSSPVYHRLRDNNGDNDAMDPGEQELFIWSGFLPNPPFSGTSSPFVTEIGAAPKDSFPIFNCPPSTTYCTPLFSSNGCFPSVSSAGTPSLGNPGGFTVTGSALEDNKNGLVFFGTTGQNSAPFFGGTLCVLAPLYRLPVQNSGGSGLCTGSITRSLADYLNHPSGGSALTAGTVVNSQVWFRDPLAPQTVGLSGGLEFVVCP